MLAILLADLNILHQGGDGQVDAAALAVDVHQLQLPQGLKGRLLNDQMVEADAGGVVVVEDDELAIDRAVDIRLHGKIGGAVAGCHKSGAGVLFLNAAQAAVRYHFDCLVLNFDRIHCELFLSCPFKMSFNVFLSQAPALWPGCISVWPSPGCGPRPCASPPAALRAGRHPFWAQRAGCSSTGG